VGSARTAFCSGRTVTQPVPSASNKTAATHLTPLSARWFSMLDLELRLPLEIRAQAPEIALYVRIAVLGEQHHVRRFQTKQDAPAQRHQNSAARPCVKRTLRRLDEFVAWRLVNPPHADRHEGRYRPVWRQIQGARAAVHQASGSLL